MAFDIELSHDIRGMTAEEVFDKIMLWLDKENAHNVIGQRPCSIEATHGSLWTLRSWERNGKKRLVFTIINSDDGIKVTVMAFPSLVNSSDVASMAVRAKLNWGLLLEDCWASVEGVEVTESGHRLKEMGKELNASERRNGRKIIAYGAFGFIITLILGILVVIATKGAIPSVVIVVPSVMFALTIFWGLMRSRSGKGRGEV